MATLIDPNPVAPDSSEPTGPETDASGVNDALFRRLKTWTQNAIDHLAEWRKEADEAYDFYAGHQWTDEEKRAFAADARVAPIFNLTAINVDAVCGLEVNNRQDVKYLPRTQGDVQINELLSSAAMWVRDEAQSEDEESDAFKDATITGLGVTETRKQDEETITIDRRDPTETFYDPSAKKPNLIDRRFGGRIVMMDTDQALDMFPGTDAVVLNAKWASLGIKVEKAGREETDYPTDQSGSVGSKDYKPKKVCLVEIEWFDWEGGRKVMKQAFLGANGVLETNPLEAWAYNFITGKRDKKSNTWYGIVRALKDPQKLINKFLATVTHIMATNAKGGLLYERGAFTDQRRAEQDWSNPQKNVELAEGALASGKVQPRVAPPLPSGAMQLIEFSMGNIRAVSGINVELLGAADRDQPASLELQRRQSAVTILASLFDAKRRYHKEQGRTLLMLMKTLPPEMLVRVVVDPKDAQTVARLFQPDQQQQQQLQQAGPGAPQMFEQMRQQFVEQSQQQDEMERFVQFQLVSQAFADESIKFDVIVDEAPSSPNQQQEIAAKLADLTQRGMQITPEAQAIIVRSIGLPSTIAEQLAKAMTEQNPQVQQMAGELQAAQQQAAQVRQELEGVKMDRGIEQARVQVDQLRAGTERTKVHADVLSKTGGVPAGEQIVPVSDFLIQLERKVEQMGAALIHLQGGLPQ